MCPQEAATVSADRDADPPEATKVWETEHKPWKDPQYRREPSCDRDEYPPAYLLSPNDQAHALAGIHQDGQMVRWVPDRQNRGAGSMWRGACFMKPLKEISPQVIVDLANDNTKNFGRQVIPVKPTSTNYKVGITVALQQPEFTIAQWNHAGAAGSQDDGLSQNPCWPQAIAPLDPGFTLLSVDRYYNNKVIPYDYSQPYVPGVNGYDPITQQSGRVRRSLDLAETFDEESRNSTMLE
jgi:hypothetical protein